MGEPARAEEPAKAILMIPHTIDEVLERIAEITDLDGPLSEERQAELASLEEATKKYADYFYLKLARLKLEERLQRDIAAEHEGEGRTLANKQRNMREFLAWLLDKLDVTEITGSLYRVQLVKKNSLNEKSLPGRQEWVKFPKMVSAFESWKCAKPNKEQIDILEKAGLRDTFIETAYTWDKTQLKAALEANPAHPVSEYVALEPTAEIRTGAKKKGR